MVPEMGRAVVMARIIALRSRIRQDRLAPPWPSPRPIAFNLFSRLGRKILRSSALEGCVPMRRTVAALASTAVLAAAAVSFMSVSGSRQTVASPHEAVFIVPTGDGYGVAECLTSGSECGQLVADAWCAGQGYTLAVGFGHAAREDLTGSVAKASATRSLDEPVAVTCRK